MAHLSRYVEQITVRDDNIRDFPDLEASVVLVHTEDIGRAARHGAPGALSRKPEGDREPCMIGEVARICRAARSKAEGDAGLFEKGSGPEHGVVWVSWRGAALEPTRWSMRRCFAALSVIIFSASSSDAPPYFIAFAAWR